MFVSSENHESEFVIFRIITEKLTEILGKLNVKKKNKQLLAFSPKRNIGEACSCENLNDLIEEQILLALR